jgi:hypothetical protein
LRWDAVDPRDVVSADAHRHGDGGLVDGNDVVPDAVVDAGQAAGEAHSRRDERVQVGRGGRTDQLG